MSENSCFTSSVDVSAGATTSAGVSAGVSGGGVSRFLCRSDRFVMVNLIGDGSTSPVRGKCNQWFEGRISDKIIRITGYKPILIFFQLWWLNRALPLLFCSSVQILFKSTLGPVLHRNLKVLTLLALK